LTASRREPYWRGMPILLKDILAEVTGKSKEPILNRPLDNPHEGTKHAMKEWTVLSDGVGRVPNLRESYQFAIDDGDDTFLITILRVKRKLSGVRDKKA
jgi:hypothetical protein